MILMPGISLLAYAFLGPLALILMGILIPVSVAIGVTLSDPRTAPLAPPPDLHPDSAVLDPMRRMMTRTEDQGTQVICMVALLRSPMMAPPTGYARDVLLDRVRTSLRGADLALWIAPDALCVLIAPSRAVDRRLVVAMAERFQVRLQTVIEHPHQSERFSATFGISVSRPDLSAEAQLDHAKDAARKALDHAQSTILLASGAESTLMATAAEDASTRQRFDLLFHPRICTDTGAVLGAEVAVLPRPQQGWTRPLDGTGDARPPDAIAVVQKLASVLHGWDRAEFPIPYVALRVPGEALFDPDWPTSLAQTLSSTGLAADRLRLIVNGPDLAVGHPDEAPQTLGKFGIAVELAGFDAPNMTLAQLEALPLTGVILEAPITEGVAHDKAARKRTSAALFVAERLGVPAGAPQVQTRQDHCVLAQLGCAWIQGPAIAPPLSIERFPFWWHRHDRSLAALPCIETALKHGNS